MKYQTIYATSDRNEISVLKNLFEQEKIDFKIVQEENVPSKAAPVRERFQVAEDDREKARELLDQTGFLSPDSVYAAEPSPAQPSRKWIFFLLGALLLIILIFLIGWFLAAE